MQRQAYRAAYSRYHAAHSLRLIDIRQTDVHIQNLRARLSLLDRLRDDIIHIVFTKRLLKTLFACRIDPLADDAHAFAKFADFARRTDAAHGLFVPARRSSRKRRVQRLNECGRRAAATADIRRANIRQRRAVLRKLFRRGAINACFRIGQTGIRFENQRKISAGAHRLENGRDFLRSKRTVHAQRIHAQRVKRHRRRIRPAAQKRAAGSFKRHRSKNRQICAFLRRQNARAKLV